MIGHDHDFVKKNKMFGFIQAMNDQDLLDIYAQRREEYVAMKRRVNDIRRELKAFLDVGDMTGFRDAQFQADILCTSFQRVQDSMWHLESKVCDILPMHRPPLDDEEN